jgi:hypothetical protein
VVGGSPPRFRGSMNRPEGGPNWFKYCDDETLARHVQKFTAEALVGTVPYSWYEATMFVLLNEVQQRISERARLGILGKADS